MTFPSDLERRVGRGEGVEKKTKKRQAAVHLERYWILATVEASCPHLQSELQLLPSDVAVDVVLRPCYTRPGFTVRCEILYRSVEKFFSGGKKELCHSPAV